MAETPIKNVAEKIRGQNVADKNVA